MTELKKGTFFSYLQLILTNIGGLLVTPYIVRMLGASEYGLYTLIGAFVGYLSILDLGLNNAIVRYVAQYRAQNDTKGQQNFLAITLIIYFAIGFLLLIFGAVFYFNIDVLFKDSLSPGELIRAKQMLVILIFNIAFTIPGGAFTGICNGYEQFSFPRILNIIKYLLRTVSVIGVLKLGSNALGIVIIDTLMNLLYILISFFYVIKILKVKIKLYAFDWLFVKEIFGYSFWIFVFGLIYQFQWRTGQIILGVTTNTTTVAIYGLGVVLGVYFMTFGNVLNSLILPKAVTSVFNNSDNLKLTNEFVKVSRLSLILLMYVFGGFLLLGEQFINLWVGDEYKESWIVALLIMIAYIIPISQGYAHAILEAKKKMRFKSLASLILTSLGIVIGAYFSSYFGLNGMIYGLFSALICLQILVSFYYHKSLKLNVFSYLKQALFPFLALLLIVCLVTHYLISFNEIGWIVFLTKGVIYTVVFLLTTSFFLNNYEKNLIFKLVKFSK